MRHKIVSFSILTLRFNDGLSTDHRKTFPLRFDEILLKFTVFLAPPSELILTSFFFKNSDSLTAKVRRGLIKSVFTEGNI